jgi:signal transduction histidine kinase
MKFASIRLRLPASYAIVALLAAISLGSLMLLVLYGYYTRQERDFMLGNAEVARSVVERVLQSDLPAQALEDQVKGLAFLSQTQIRVLDAGGKALADSGAPGANQVVSFSGDPQGMVVLSIGGGTLVQGGGIHGSGSLTVNEAGMASQAAPSVDTASGQPAASSAGTGSLVSPQILQVNASPFGYGFTSARPADTRRSAQVVTVPFLSQPGSLEISNGPAYGADILHSVALAWLLASLAAVGLAGLAGIIASRQVTQPVLALTDAARRMQYGDLSSRAILGNGKQTLEFSVLAKTFNGMAQRVEDTVATLRGFVSDAAHELNTPLTALHTNLELALNEPDSGQKQIFLNRAVEQNARLERLAGGLLDLSRLEAAQTAAPECETLDWASMTAEIGERFASRAEQAERSFTLDLPTSPLLIQGNALQLMRLLDNLLENALKFTPAGGTIRLGLERKDEFAVLCVADSGIGIPAEDLPHLFERFHRGRNSAEYPGTGLGLAIVKAIVELHGGQVKAQSAGRGQGSQFYVWLAAQV